MLVYDLFWQIPFQVSFIVVKKKPRFVLLENTPSPRDMTQNHHESQTVQYPRLADHPPPGDHKDRSSFAWLLTRPFSVFTEKLSSLCHLEKLKFLMAYKHSILNSSLEAWEVKRTQEKIWLVCDISVVTKMQTRVKLARVMAEKVSDFKECLK